MSYVNSIKDLFYFLPEGRKRIKKRNEPVSFETFKDFVLNKVNCFNTNVSNDFLKEKYKVYKSNVPIKDPNTSHKRIGIYSQYNTKIEYFTSRGWSVEESKEMIKKRQSLTTKKSFIHRYGKEKGIKKYNEYIEKHSKNYKKNLEKGHHKMFYRPSQVEYWLNKGYTYTQSYEKMHNFYSRIGKKYHKKRRERGEEFLTHWQLKFWLSKGFSLSEARKQLKRIHDTRSLESCINRYGEKEGHKKFKEFNKKWQDSLNSKPEKEKIKILYKKLRGINRYSNKSINLFNSIFNCLYKDYGIYFEKVYMGNNEKFIYDTKNKKIYFYDLYIPYVNLIVEYHGIAFHPNPNYLSENEWYSWRNPLSKLSADEQYKKDILKKELALNNGHNYIEVWENENFEENKNKIIKKILKLYEYEYEY